MATTPVPTPTTAVTTPVSTFLKAHERLIIIVLCLMAGSGLYLLSVSAWEKHDQRADTLAHATLQASITSESQIATANATAATQYQALAVQLAAANKTLATAQTTRNNVTQTQQATDRTLPPNALAVRWTTLLNVDPASIQVEPGGKEGPDALVITPEAAQDTVVQLENVPTLQADLKDEQTVVSNQDTQITSLAGVNVGLNKQIDVLDIENTDEIKACTDDKKLLKAQARKSKLRWFGAGVVVGFIGRQLVKTYAGF